MKTKNVKTENGRMGGEPDTDVALHSGDYYSSSSYYGESNSGSESYDVVGLDPMKWVHMLLRRWKTILLMIIAGGACGALYLTQAVSIYRAEAEFEMSVRRPKIIKNNVIFEDQVGDVNSVINTRFAKFRSPAMEQLAVKHFGDKYPGTDKSDAYLASQVRHVVSWEKDRNASIVRVSMESSDRVFAARLVNILTVCADELMIKENQDSSEGAVKWLADQAEEKRIALEKVEGELTALRQAVQLDALSQEREAQKEALTVLIQEKITLNSRLSEREMVAKYAKSVKNSQMELSSLPPSFLNKLSLQDLVTQWRDASDQLIEVDRRYSDIHPSYKAAVVVEQQARTRLESAIQVASSDIENEVDFLKTQLHNLSKQVDELREKSAELEQQVITGEQKLQNLRRKYEAAESAYQAVLKRMDEARMAADETTAFTKVIRAASIPMKAIYPNTFRVAALALLLGLLAGIGISLMMEFWADEISDVNDLRLLGLNILGTVPPQKNTDRNVLSSIGLKDKFHYIFEVFAGINSIISSNVFRSCSKVLVVCSAMPEEGKTICACNMAVSAAMNGSKTLLIDGDLRNPRLGAIFDIDENCPSLFEWLNWVEWLVDGEDDDPNLSYADLTTQGIHDNLDLITSRRVNDINPSELLGRKKLVQLLNWARDHYDRVIIDSPPIGMVGDAQMLANFADSVIIVSRLNVTSKSKLKFVLNRFSELGTHVLGCIANDVPTSVAEKFQGGYNDYVVK